MGNMSRRHVPINLRQSGDFDAKMLLSTRVRKSPYFHLAKAAGCWCYTVYNRVYHPRAYIAPEDGGLLKEYEYLTEHVTMWDVAVERQIQVKGPDAEKFVDLVITRDVKKVETGKARYVILCNLYGGIINDPVLLRVADDDFWFSLADSDVGLYLQGVNAVAKMDVEINEIDVCPVQIQGPKAQDLIRALVGPAIDDVPYYGLLQNVQVGGCDVVISRSGFSGEAGVRDLPHRRDDQRRRDVERGAGGRQAVQPAGDRAGAHPPHRGRHPELGPGHGHRDQPLSGRTRLADQL